MKFSLLLISTFFFSLSNAQGSGNVLSYNGSNRYINLGSQVGDNCRTIEFWFKPATNINSSIPDAISLITRDYLNGSGLNTNEYGFYFTPPWSPGIGGKLTFYRRVGQAGFMVYSNAASWQANTWYHVAGVIDPVLGMRMYINGVLQTDTDPSTQTIPVQTGAATDMVAIATWGYWGAFSGNRFFNGDIDEIRFWTSARTQTQVRDNMCRTVNPSQANLRAYYRFDSNLTSVLPDLTGNGFNGTLTNIPTSSWHYSSAPIGDTSVCVYPASWIAQNLSLQYAPGDQFSISTITTSPAGAHIYRVNSLPNVTTGLTTPLPDYYGVFLTSVTGNYDISYDYSANTSFCSAGCIGFFTRNDNAVLSWNPINPVYTNCSLSKTNESTNGNSFREEYILGTNSFSFAILGNDTTLCASSSYMLNVNIPGSTLLWSNNSTSTQLLVNATGIYWVDVTLNGCTRRDSITINISTPITSLVSNQQNVTCAGGNNGTATIIPSGGSGPYNYSWSPSGGTTATANGIPAGNYTCTITDANGCSLTQTVNITQPSPIAITTSSVNELCNGGNNGSATASVTGGTGSYSYNWLPSGGTSATASSLFAGNYTVNVTDANGCIVSQSISVAQPTAVSAPVTTTPAGCPTTGSASVAAMGGTGPYTYSWSSGGTGTVESNLGAGNYSLTVIDAAGCSITQSFTIILATAVNATLSSVNLSCFGNSTGTATVNPSGGNPPYTYAWSPTGGNNATATGLTAGTYTCIITDQNGCTIQQTTTITQPTQIAIVPTSNNVTCNGFSNGSAATTVTGGNIPYTYSWSPSGGNASTASGLSASTYSITVTDNSGCSMTQSLIITQPTQITVITTGDSICRASGATISLVAGGGVGPYTYSWSNSATGSAVNVSPAQTTTYSAIVTDANGCTSSATTTVVVYPVPAAAYTAGTVNNVYFINGTSGQLCFTDASSSNISAWLWDMNGTISTTQSPCIIVTTADTGTFCTSLVVTDNHNCQDTTISCLTIELGEGEIIIPNVFTPNDDGVNDIFTITVGRLTGVKCSIYDRWGVLITRWDDPHGYWDGTNKNGKLCTDGTYYFVAELTDFTGKQVSKTGFIQLISKK
ncbi:MAG: gliding motility-associated C-terminal domain-containing protein [Bacteroidia bacterium]